jgi:hypothetical protein
MVVMDIYTLSRNFFNWSFENPDKINTNHVALYFFCIENCNRLGWKEKFGLPTSMAKEAIGIKNFRTYKKTLDDLVEFGFILMIEKSKNQYSSNIIAIVKYTKAHAKAHAKALDKALIKHSTKQSKSIDSIDIPIYNNTSIQDTNTQIDKNDFYILQLEYLENLDRDIYDKLKTEYGIIEPLIYKHTNQHPITYYDLVQHLAEAIKDDAWKQSLITRFGLNYKFTKAMADYFNLLKTNYEYLNFKDTYDFRKYFANWFNTKKESYK